MSRLNTFTYHIPIFIIISCVTDLNPTLNIPARHEGRIRVWLRKTSVTLCWHTATVKSRCRYEHSLASATGCYCSACMLGRQLLKRNSKRLLYCLCFCCTHQKKTDKTNKTEQNRILLLIPDLTCMFLPLNMAT